MNEKRILFSRKGIAIAVFELPVVNRKKFPRSFSQFRTGTRQRFRTLTNLIRNREKRNISRSQRGRKTNKTMKFTVACSLLLAIGPSCFMGTTNAFSPTSLLSSSNTRSVGIETPLRMAGGDGSDSEWVKALMESTGPEVGQFEKDMKMKGLLGKKGEGNTKLSANAQLVAWLEKEGDVYLSEESSWGEAPHPMAISTETKDEITNESSGRGLLARRDINEGANLLKIPIKLCITRDSARKALGKDALQNGINEYLAVACQLIHERYVLGDKSYYAPYMGVLPETDEVNPTFTWPDEDLEFLVGSPVIAATRSLQMKLKREYDDLLGGDDGLIAKFPDRFPAEVCTLSEVVGRILSSSEVDVFSNH